MIKNIKSYRNLLKRMLIIETIGENIYKKIYLKTKNKSLRKICGKLASSEQQAAEQIERELFLLNNSPKGKFRKITLATSSFIFSLLTAGQLFSLLERSLKRRMYGRWFNLYGLANRNFWERLLEHENTQYQLLEPFFKKVMG